LLIEKILVVEDEQDIADLIEYHLKQSGFSVITALDGPSGLERGIKARPNLIILDLMLPGMDDPHAYSKDRGSGSGNRF
jgi:two-component system alkaline phosphatase synthesis response regulator PhoP